jgi:hypothetical protein
MRVDASTCRGCGCGSHSVLSVVVILLKKKENDSKKKHTRRLEPRP